MLPTSQPPPHQPHQAVGRALREGASFDRLCGSSSTQRTVLDQLVRVLRVLPLEGAPLQLMTLHILARAAGELCNG